MTDTSICLSQGAGSYTFGMYSTLTPGPFPLAAGGGALNEDAAAWFLVMDNSCKVLGIFPQPNCGIPYVLEANYLDYVLTLTAIDSGVGEGYFGEGYFSFEYGNGAYSIDNNQCGCMDSTEGLTAVLGCKCAFPVAGEPTKRSIAFEA